MFGDSGFLLFVVRAVAFSLIITRFFEVPGWVGAALGAALAGVLSLIWPCRK